MKLQTKVTIILAGAWLAICLIIYADSKWVISANFQRVEHAMVQMEVRDVERAYQHSLLSLKMYATAWAVWDEAYSFMQTKDPRFIATNFVPGTFVSSNINFFMFYTVKGSLYYGLFYDLNTNKMSDVPSSLLNYLEVNNDFVKHPDEQSSKSGILSTKDGLVLMTSLPVLTGDQRGPVRGALLMGYYLNDRYFSQLADTVGLDLSFIPMASVIQQPELRVISSRLLVNESDNVITVDDEMAHGYILLRDIANNPVGLIQIDIPRTIYQQGLSTAYHYFSIVVILGLFVIFLVWYLLTLLVTRRVINIGRQVQRISQANRFNKKIRFYGNDELSGLVSSINSMIQIIGSSQTQLKYLATHDALTDLPNRELFYDLLSRAMADASRYGYKIAVLYLDMDKFKYVNDQYGHHAGDKLLQTIAKRLKNTVRESDVVARLAGDEFVVLMGHVKELSQVSAFAENLLKIGNRPFKINDTGILATFSIGIGVYSGGQTAPSELMHQADLAMYEAKKVAGNAYRFYDQKKIQES